MTCTRAPYFMELGAAKLRQALRNAIAIGIVAMVPVCSFGEQHEEVRSKPLLRTSRSWDGSPLVYPRLPPEITGVLIEIPPGAETAWHVHPVPSVAVVLEGVLEVRLATGKARQFNAGEAFAEVIDAEHKGRNVGSTPVRLIIFYVGAVGKPITLHQPQSKW